MPLSLSDDEYSAREKPTSATWFGDRCRAIGLDRSAHGLRKISARLYAEAGKKEQALMALFGWRDPAMAHYYGKRADRKRWRSTRSAA